MRLICRVNKPSPSIFDTCFLLVQVVSVAPVVLGVSVIPVVQMVSMESLVLGVSVIPVVSVVLGVLVVPVVLMVLVVS